MAEWIEVDIVYDVPHTEEAVRIALDTLAASVAEVWDLHAGWRAIEPSARVEPEAWLEAHFGGELQEWYEEPWYDDDEDHHHAEKHFWQGPIFRFSFSPVTKSCADLYFKKERGRFGLNLSARRGTFSYGGVPHPAGLDAVGGMDSDDVSRTNKRFFLYIVENIRKAHPVRSFEIDDLPSF